MSGELRDRYRALLRCYPADYRTERGDEIVDTYLDLARPGQRRPRSADVLDLLRGGMRQHLRARHALGLVDALPFAAHLALTTAASLAGLWLFRVERIVVPEEAPWQSVGPFGTLGAIVWILWLLTPLAALLGAGRPMVAVALLGTVALLPVFALTEYLRPPLLVLVPQAALGLVALAVPGRRGSPASLSESLPSLCESLSSRWESPPSRPQSTPSRHQSPPHQRESLPERHIQLPGIPKPLPGIPKPLPERHESSPEHHESPLTIPNRRPPSLTPADHRRSPFAAAGLAVTAVTAGLAALSQPIGLYYLLLPDLSCAGLLLASVVGAAAAAVFTVRRDPRGWWPALVLLARYSCSS